MDANFYGGGMPDPSVDPMGYMRQQQMAQGLRQQGAQSPQGSMAGGQYVPPAPTAYATQLASALAGGQKSSQLADATRASSILNGGTGAVQSNLGKLGGWVGNLFSGGA